MKKHLLIIFCLIGYVLLFPFAAKAQKTPNEQLNHIKINVRYDQTKPGDSILLYFSPQSGPQRIREQYYAIVDPSGTATFNIEVLYPYGYLDVYKTKATWKNGHKVLLEKLFWEKQDSITLNIKEPSPETRGQYFNATTIEGTGKTKYEAILLVQGVHAKMLKEQQTHVISSRFDGRDNALDFSIQDTLMDKQQLQKALQQYKNQITPFAYNVIIANALSIEYEAPLSKFRSEMLTLIKRKGKLFTDTICYELTHEYLPLRKIVIDDHSLAAGAYYARFYASYFNFLEMLSSHDYNEINVINNIVSNSKGAVRDAILCSFLDQMGYNEQNKTIYDIAYDYLSDPYYIKEFNHIKSKCSINTNKYELVDTQGKQIKLSKFNGKLLLIDIWHTGCGGCTQYYKNIITKLEEEYKNDNRFQIISISTDKNEQTWKNSINKNIYTHPGAINVYTGGKGSFHPFFTELGIRAAPTPILIDQNGNTIDFDSYRLWDLGLLRKQIQEHIK